MSYILKDDQAPAYYELWDFIPGIVRAAGWGQVYQDVFGFNMVASITVTDEVTFIFEARQVLITKLTGTGEAITAGQRLYATLASNFQSVTANPTGTIGTDYYFVGWAKKDAGANDTTVLARFWGHEYDHADRDV